ncbi:MAG: GAF domain-containing protein [Bacteroidales bacterium]|nr:GAF domain-containing protein [Bacteroidales bacterium]
MNTPEQLSVKLKFRIMLICFAAYAVLTGLSFYYLISKYNEIDNSYKAEIKMKNDLSEIRNLQYELFNLYSSKRDKEKEDTLTTSINKICINIEKGIQELKNSELDFNRKTSQSIVILSQEFDNYKQKITDITKTKGEINELTDDGGRLSTDRNIVRKTLLQFTIAGISKMFEEACRIERSFLENCNIQDYNKFNKQIDAINAILKSTNTSNILIKYQMSKMMDQITEYKVTFNLVFYKQLQLGIETNDGYKGEATAQIKTMQNDIEELMMDSNTIRNEKRNSTIRNIAIIQISVIVLGLTFFLILFSSVNKPIERISNYLKKILRGELNIPQINSKSKNEMDLMGLQLIKFVQNLKEKQLFAEDVGNGNPDKGFELLSEDDELGNSLINMKKNLETQYEKQRKRREADEIQDKINIGLAEFGDILRKNNNNLDKLCDETTRNLIHYMQANYGAMYIYNDDNPDDIFMEMKSTYAADNKKFIQKRINLYEGIVGTCAVEKTMQIIDDIPNNYVKIGSGFGFTNPGHLLVVPLLLKGEIYGIIELCRTDKFEEYRIKFIEHLAEDIASTISYVKENAKNLFKLQEEGKRLDDYTKRIANYEIEIKQKDNEIKNYEKEIEHLKRENQKLIENTKELQNGSNSK